MDDQQKNSSEQQNSESAGNCREVSRRGFILGGVAAAAGTAATAAALAPLRHLKDTLSIEEFLQGYYKEMTPEEKEAVLERIRLQVERKYDVRPNLTDPPPMAGVEFMYALSIGRCIGCRRCVHACVKENNQSRDPEIQYIRVLKMEKGTIDLDCSHHYYEEGGSPDPTHYYMPVQCFQCADPPCVKVCPVKATWQQEDGIVVIDYNWCIGCRYCQAACPYWGRRFNFTEPGGLSKENINPDMAYFSNRPRSKGVMEKCHFCLQRTRRGRYPACVEVCPTGSRKFGNVLDPDSEISYVLKNRRVFILKEEVKTLPRFFYYFDI